SVSICLFRATLLRVAVAIDRGPRGTATMCIGAEYLLLGHSSVGIGEEKNRLNVWEKMHPGQIQKRAGGSPPVPYTRGAASCQTDICTEILARPLYEAFGCRTSRITPSRSARGRVSPPVRRPCGPRIGTHRGPRPSRPRPQRSAPSRT